MKQAHIYIYGVIDFWQDDHSTEWGYVNLKSVKNQIENHGAYDEIIVHIHSDGGVVSEGFAIHDYLRSLGKPVTTQIEGNCFSIATVIALAGDKRTMTTNAEFLIHNPWGWAGGEKEDIKKYADELEKLEEKIADFYVTKTNLSKQEALDFMKVETTFTPEQALEKGFITEIAQVMQAVALYRPNNKNSKNKSNKKTKMSKETLTKKEANKRFKSLGETLNGILNIVKSKGKAVNLIIQDANGTEIDFTELEADATPKVGDKATIDGEPATGEHVIPSGETYVFEDGALAEIKEAGEDENEETEALKQENAQLKAKNKKVKKDLKKASEQIKNFVSEFKELKKNVSSSFNYDPKIDTKKEGKGGKTKSRSLFKKNND